MAYYVADRMEIDSIGFARVGMIVGLYFWRKVTGLQAYRKGETILYYDQKKQQLHFTGTEEQAAELNRNFDLELSRQSHRRQDAFLVWFDCL